jgi:hypothetical protein
VGLVEHAFALHRLGDVLAVKLTFAAAHEIAKSTCDTGYCCWSENHVPSDIGGPQE